MAVRYTHRLNWLLSGLPKTTAFSVSITIRVLLWLALAGPYYSVYAQVSPPDAPTDFPTGARTVRVGDASLVLPDDWVPSPEDLRALAPATREPARFIGILVPPPTGSPPRSPGRPPSYGTLLNSAVGSLSFALEVRRETDAAYAVSQYRATVAAGKPLTLQLFSHGHRFAGVVDASRAAIFPARWRYYRTVTTTGTNVDLARQEGYDCFDVGPAGTLCSPPGAPESSCSIGRRPNRVENYCSPLGRSPDQAATAEAWQESAERLRYDIGNRVDELLHADIRPQWSEADQRIYTSNMEGYRRAVYLASTTIALDNPRPRRSSQCRRHRCARRVRCAHAVSQPTEWRQREPGRYRPHGGSAKCWSHTCQRYGRPPLRRRDHSGGDTSIVGADRSAERGNARSLRRCPRSPELGLRSYAGWFSCTGHRRQAFVRIRHGRIRQCAPSNDRDRSRPTRHPGHTASPIRVAFNRDERSQPCLGRLSQAPGCGRRS